MGDAASRLYAEHRAELVEYARRILGDATAAEDVVQDAWLRMRALDAERTLDEPKGYFYRIIRNLALDRLRVGQREQRRGGGELNALEGLPADAPSPERETLARDELRLVLESLAELPERTQTALRMHRIEGRKLKEIAAHLGVSIALAHSLVAEGMAHCARRLKRR